MYRIILVGLAVAMLCGCILYVRSTPHGTTAYVAGPAVRVRPALRPIEHSQIEWSPEYDMYRYGGYWYWYSSGTWYRSTRYDGGWYVVTVLPSVFYDVPRSHRVYTRLPRRERYTPGRPTWKPISRRPTLRVIGGTSVYEATGIGMDLFFYGSTWYWYTGGVWYNSRNYNGPWQQVSAVPTAFHKIPPGHRKHHVIRKHVPPTKKLRDKKPTPARTTKPPKKGGSPVRKLRQPTPPPKEQPKPPTRTIKPPKDPLKKVTPTPAKPKVIPEHALKRSKATPAIPATPARPGSGLKRATPAIPATPPSKGGKTGKPTKPETPPGKDKEPKGVAKGHDKEKGPKKDKDDEDEDEKKKKEKEKEKGRRTRGNR